jgi:DNA-binding MltR family transcriptional regulator
MPTGLKKLLKTRPAAKEISALVAEIKTDGPRGAAVVAGALVDDILRDLLLSRMVALTNDETNRLFSGSAPLGSFATRIALGYALGIYGPRTRHDLQTLKDIRNAFAHANRVISFDTREVANLCSGFHCLEALKNREGRVPQELLSIATKCLIVHLLEKTNSPESIGVEGLD